MPIEFRILPKRPRDIALSLFMLLITLAIPAFIVRQMYHIPKMHPALYAALENRARIVCIMEMTLLLAHDNPELMEQMREHLQKGYTVNEVLSALLMNEYADKKNRSRADFADEMKMVYINWRYYLADADQKPFEMTFENGILTIISENQSSLAIPLKHRDSHEFIDECPSE